MPRSVLRGELRWFLRRGLWVYLATLLLAGLLAGPERLSASTNNHFTHLAQGWLEGRLALESDPPGYCSAQERRAGRCKQHRHDDWAVVWTLELDEGESVRAFPCRTEACRSLRTQGLQRWWVVGEGWRDFERNSLRSKSAQWYVSFPPGPALLFLPGVALWGLAFWDRLFTALLFAAIPVVLLHFLDRERGRVGRNGRENLYASLALAWVSPALLLGSHGRVWFTAQIVGALFLSLYLHGAWKARRPGLAGFALALAILSRPLMVAALPFFLIEWRRERKRAHTSWSALGRFLIPLVLFGLAAAWLNWSRFEDPLEFGHRYLDIRWQARIQSIGLFSFEYLGRNLRCLLSLMPQVQDKFPYLRFSIHGSALWLSVPWLLYLATSKKMQGRGLTLSLCALAIALPALLYQNSGQVQFSYRFALDWLPLVIPILAIGGAASRRGFLLTLLLGFALNLYGAYFFARDPGHLFVSKPLGWPFQEELQRPPP